MILGKKLEDIPLQAYSPDTGAMYEWKISDSAGKWLVVLFYPQDFTWVCPTELADLASIHSELNELDTHVVSVSTDSKQVHMAWRDTEPMLSDVNFPMIADPLGKLSKQFGVFDEDTGFALRGVFLVDPVGVVRYEEITMYDVGRNMAEVLRKLKAYKYVEKNPGMACPARWDEGRTPLEKTLDIVGNVGEAITIDWDEVID
jgi:peroxiredoxin (alkyl hydroperoxide reductase subunit C)